MDALPLNWCNPPSGPMNVPAAGVDVWLVDVRDGVTREQASRATLSADELARFDRMRVAEKRTQAIAVRAALRTILSRYVDVQPDALAFAYGPYEKPALASPLTSPRLEFNVSHAGVWGLVAVAAGRSVGVDLEETRPLHNAASFARTVLAPAELVRHEVLPAEQQLAALFNAWTCKEAVLKGAGLGIALSPAAVELTPCESGRCEAVFEWEGQLRRWRVALLAPAAGCCGAAALPVGSPWGEVRAFACPATAAS